MRRLAMGVPILVATIAALVVAPSAHGQRPSEAQLDSLMAGSLDPNELVIREWIRATVGGGQCDTELAMRRLPGLDSRVTWEIGWDDGVNEYVVEAMMSRLDYTWTNYANWIPSRNEWYHEFAQWLWNWQFEQSGTPRPMDELKQDAQEMVDALEDLARSQSSDGHLTVRMRDAICK